VWGLTAYITQFFLTQASLLLLECILSQLTPALVRSCYRPRTSQLLIPSPLSYRDCKMKQD
jgi:hypothetical protein